MRNDRIDFLKTAAILAVFFYHAGTLPNGYLGVEIFFVVSGYLMMRHIQKEMNADNFSPVRFLFGKVAGFMPTMVLVFSVSLAAACVFMLPDNLENFAESVVASSFFAENILECLTTQNYWNPVNTYKPLMHLWYLGILMQAFALLSILLYVVWRVAHKRKNSNFFLWTLGCISCISLGLYLLSDARAAYKFYYLPFRLYEITLGGMVAFIQPRRLGEKKAIAMRSVFTVLLVVLFFAEQQIADTIAVILTVFCSCGYLCGAVWTEEKCTLSPIVTWLGRHSFPVYLWHQVVIAFLRYAVFPNVTFAFVMLSVILTIGLSFATIKFMEGLRSISKGKMLAVCIPSATLLCAISLVIFLKAGVIHDIPELGISKDNAYRGMHSSYCDRVYEWDRDFETEDKIHVLIVGDSFGRDFANILAESEYADMLEISYVFAQRDVFESRLDRVEAADMVLFTVHPLEEVMPWIRKNVADEKLYVIGDKSFGNSMGIVYAKRCREDYFSQRITIDSELLETNLRMSEEFGSRFIDMLSPLLEGETVPAFTEDGHFISQDGEHLTQYGAQYYAHILDLNFLLVGSVA